LNKKIDVLIAVYNGEKYVRQQIESILGQSYKNIHLWIRDNHSEDNSVNIIEDIRRQHPQQITLITSSQNVGAIGNFAHLAQQAQADYIMFSDADDVWLPEKIAKTMHRMQQMEATHSNRMPLLVHTDLTVVKENLDVIHPSFWIYAFLKPKLPHNLPRQLIQNQITGCTVMVNRALLDIAKPIPNDICMHDWWLGICTAAFGKCDALDEATMLYRQHGKNQVGAKKYSLFSMLKLLPDRIERKKSLHNQKMTFIQARTFIERYRNRLTMEQINILEAFLELNSASYWKRAKLVSKFGFFRVGFLRNLQYICTGNGIITRILRLNAE
jgi:glycosyltransferase involved in cell wall biosynthesis